MCYLSQDYPWKNNIQKYFDQALYEYLIDVLSKYFKTVRVTPSRSEIYNVGEFFRYIHSRKLPVISFNYDTLFESLYIEYCKKNKYIQYTKDDKYKPKNHSYLIRIYDKYSKIDDEIKTEILKNGFHKGESYMSNQCKHFTIYTTNINKLLEEPDFELDGMDLRRIQAETYKNLKMNHLYKLPMTYINERLNRKIDDSQWEYEIAHLLKLHGSSNWYYNDNELFYEDFQVSRGYVLNPTEFSGKESFTREDYLNFYTSLRNGLKPLIIPPVLDKTNFYTNSVLKDQWLQAAKYLQNADSINIIGYSIPETDLAIQYFLQANINPDTKINIINLCPKKDENALIAYKESFKNKLGGFRNVNTEYVHYDAKEVLEKFIKEEIVTQSDNEFIKACFNKAEINK